MKTATAAAISTGTSLAIQSLDRVEDALLAGLNAIPLEYQKIDKNDIVEYHNSLIQLSALRVEISRIRDNAQNELGRS